MTEELYRLETVLSALTVGICADWSEEHVGQHGMEARKHPLAAALDYLLAYQTRGAFCSAMTTLATELEQQKIGRRRDSVDNARDALMYWLFGKCPACCGTGVLSIHQEVCTECGGSGKNPASEIVQHAMKIIESHQEVMEMALRRDMGKFA